MQLSTPLASFPLVSGDTFKYFAGMELDGKNLKTRSGADTRVLFAKNEPASIDTLLQKFRPTVSAGRFPSLVLHNGDHSLTSEEREALEARFAQIHAVNVVRESARTKALPIGLENRALNNHGKYDFFLSELEKARGTDRSRLVFSSFNVANNYYLRRSARDLFARSRFGFDGHVFTRNDYRSMLSQSCFVISPPGNGPDCHRTWEAVYAGAVPVVLRDFISDTLAETMPILAIDDYTDFVEKSDEELVALYRELSVKPPYMAFATFWVQAILPANDQP